MKRILVLLIALIFCISSTALAFQNEPTGFRELPWESPVKALLTKYPDCQKVDMYDDSLRPLEMYRVSIANDSISKVPLIKPISYVFWDNKLMQISIDIDGDSNEISMDNISNMHSALITLYGAPTQRFVSNFAEEYEWDGPVSIIRFTVYYYNIDGKKISSGHISLRSKKIFSESINYMKERHQSEAKQGW